jgi:serine phosphatase RsbU (regulator of sigma subunit)
VASNEVEWISLSHEIEAASKIQAAILPKIMPNVSGLIIAARYSPMTGVAGISIAFPNHLPTHLV